MQSFICAVNPGEPVRPLGDVASGGELSRIMLAIKTVLADEEDTPTLIFDEIDSRNIRNRGRSCRRETAVDRKEPYR